MLQHVFGRVSQDGNIDSKGSGGWRVNKERKGVYLIDLDLDGARINRNTAILCTGYDPTGRTTIIRHIFTVFDISVSKNQFLVASRDTKFQKQEDGSFSFIVLIGPNTKEESGSSDD